MSSPDPRTGRMTDAGNEGTDGDAVEASVSPGVADGVADAEVDAGGDDIGGEVVAAAQPTTRRPTTIVVATHESEQRIPSPPDDVSGETFGAAPCYFDHSIP
jgi:hypothetical protein